MLIAGNWKMFKGPGEARAFFEAFEPPEGVDVVVCPPYASLAAAVESGFTTYAQNVHWEPTGAYTGEISPPMLRELGVHGTLVGHSERRQLFGETDEAVARRARAALEEGLGVIACVGETLEQRESGDTELVLKIQVEAIAFAAGEHERLVLAYEPVWAIGTGRTATPEQAVEAHAFIKGLLDRPVLYGGSVKPENAAALLAQPGIDGALVGGASLEPASFAAICRAAAEL
jgi:triosephosphate isomerase